MLMMTTGAMLIFTKIGQHIGRRSKEFAASIKLRIWAAYGGKGVALCWACGEIADEIDHLLPMKDGGGNNFENGRPICFACNRDPNLVRPGVIEAVFEPDVRAIRQVCWVANCDREVYARSLCVPHYRRQQNGYRGSFDAPIRVWSRAPSGVNGYEWMLIRRALRESRQRSTR